MKNGRREPEPLAVAAPRQTAPVWPGSHQRLGATWTPEATNFAVWSPEATAVWVCLFAEDGTESRHQLTEHTLGVWHGAARRRSARQLYGFRADGPWDPRTVGASTPPGCCSTRMPGRSRGEVGHGPGDLRPRDPAHPHGDRARPTPRRTCRAAWWSRDDFDWEGDRRAAYRWRDTVVYELHVKGMTQLHDRIPEELRGTYAGLAAPR